MVNIHVKGRYLLLESLNPKASFQSGDLGSDGIPVIYHCITNYSKTQRGRTAILFSHPLWVRDSEGLACLVRSHLGFLMGCSKYWLRPYEVTYWLESYGGFTGLNTQGGSFTWLAGFAGCWLRAQLGLPIGAHKCGPFVWSWLPNIIVTSG